MSLSSVTPDGVFCVGVHAPSYHVLNKRECSYPITLGIDENGIPVTNKGNFKKGTVKIEDARVIYEIRNPFPFRGCTYIDSGWAEARAAEPERISISNHSEASLYTSLKNKVTDEQLKEIICELPHSIKYTVAQNSQNPEELILLASSCCTFLFDKEGAPNGLVYAEKGNQKVPEIKDFELFETIANNQALPDEYKKVMVLNPGVQGTSEIVGDFAEGTTEVFEYLRSNSYIPWGHFAANFSHNSIRYQIEDLSFSDMQGLRHLYYQRIYLILAEKIGLDVRKNQKRISPGELEKLRKEIIAALSETDFEKTATLWGWNFGYDFSGSGYRLHASHQMVHQQYAMVPEFVETNSGGGVSAFSSGDMVADFIEQYKVEHQSDFFTDYLASISNNTRVDGKKGESSLVVWTDENVLLFVPKAQVSQWELQLMVTCDGEFGPVGSIVEANEAVRSSIDKGILIAQKVLAALGARMVTSIEYSKRIGIQNGQHLVYSFLPKLPWSMGAFSEAHQRYICGHYPEDFALICRQKVSGCL